MIPVHMMQVPIVQVIRVVIVFDGLVTACASVLVFVFVVCLAIHQSVLSSNRFNTYIMAQIWYSVSIFFFVKTTISTGFGDCRTKKHCANRNRFRSQIGTKTALL